MPKPNSFINLSSDDLSKKIKELEESYLQLRCEHGIGTLSNTSSLKKKKREIAQAKTFLHQKLTVASI